ILAKPGSGAKARMAHLPTFTYHPAPFSTGAIEDSDGACSCCGLARGYLSRGPIYSAPHVGPICPWCIADGSAAEKWAGSFNDPVFLDSWGDPVDVPDEVVDEIRHRTPGLALEEFVWWVHCGETGELARVDAERVQFRCRVCSKHRNYRRAD